jgi:quinol monooxygenase YgiN
MERPLVVIARMRAQTDKAGELHRTLVELMAATRNEDGCLLYDLHVGVDDPQLFAFFERWRDEDALAAHNETPHILAFRRLVPELVDGDVVVERFQPV